MPRYYEMALINPATGKIATRTDGTPYQWGTNLRGQYDAGALAIQFDIIAAPYNTPVGGSTVTIAGVALPDLFQAQNFMGTVSGKGFQFYLKGGFTAGLPLVNPSQAGTLVRGTVLQSFGNWEGTEMALSFVLNADGYSPKNPGNFVLHCKAGQTLSSALKQTFTTVYPNYGLTIQISDQIKWSHDEVGFWPSLTAMAQTINNITIGMLGDNYPGVQIWIANDTIFVSDYTVKPATKTLVYTDLIGQPRWQNLNEMQVVLNLRGDIQLGDTIRMPQNLASVPGFVTTTAQAPNASISQPLTFQGDFIVTQVRHLGDSRSPEAREWSTILNCVTTPVSRAAAGR